MNAPMPVNPDAERIMGRRRADVIAFDLPGELGYWCPICKVDPFAEDEHGNTDERLQWSEYNGFLYCYECNRDYPSALCVPLEIPNPGKVWHTAVGIDAAIKIFLSTVESVLTGFNENDDHYLNFTDTGWFIEHSLKCRVSGEMAKGCKWQREIEGIEDMVGHGRWLMGTDEDGFVTYTDASVAA